MFVYPLKLYLFSFHHGNRLDSSSNLKTIYAIFQPHFSVCLSLTFTFSPTFASSIFGEQKRKSTIRFARSVFLAYSASIPFYSIFVLLILVESECEREGDSKRANTKQTYIFLLKIWTRVGPHLQHSHWAIYPSNLIDKVFICFMSYREELTCVLLSIWKRGWLLERAIRIESII